MLLSVTIVLLLLYWLYYQTIGKRKGLPPGPIPLPIVGNLFQFDVNNPNKCMQHWREQYGPIYSVWIPKLAIFVCDYQLIKDTFVKQGDLFRDRPYIFLFDEFAGGMSTYHKGISSANGPLWQEQRLFAQRVLRDFGAGGNLMEAGIISEIERLVAYLNKLIDKSGKIVIIPNQVFSVTIGSIISNFTFGHPFNFDDERFLALKRMICEFGDHFINPKGMVLDIWPWLRYIPLFNNFGFQTFLDQQKKFRRFFHEEVEAHKRKLNLDAEPLDFFDAFLQEQLRRKEAGLDEGNYSDWQLWLAGFDMWGAGLEATANTLCWAVLYMVNFPQLQSKISEEIISELGSNHTITMADRSRLPYTLSTIYETERFANIIIPTNIPHAATKDCKLGGYAVKAGTTVIPAISTVHMDPMFFPDPQRFQPARFLEDDGKTLKKIEQHIPFGLGKRKCIGDTLANMELFLIFATLMQTFKFGLTVGQEKPSMEPIFGTVAGPRDYEVLIEKR